MRELDLWTDDTTVFFAADHGEQFGEHGVFEHGDIHVENVHVPFFIRDSSVLPRVVSSPVRMVDLAPTLLEVVGLPPLAGEGRSLSSIMRGESEPAIEVFTENETNYRVMKDPFTLIVRANDTRVYDFREDPAETRNLAEELPRVARRLRAALDSHLARARQETPPAVPAGDPDERLMEGLRELGYLE